MFYFTTREPRVRIWWLATLPFTDGSMEQSTQAFLEIVGEFQVWSMYKAKIKAAYITY